jgi:hypothetical protein
MSNVSMVPELVTAAAGGGGGSYTMRLAVCRFGQFQINKARIHTE